MEWLFDNTKEATSFRRRLGVVVVSIILLIVVFAVAGNFFFFEIVQNDEVGIGFESGRLVEVYQPGIAWKFGWFVDLVKVNVSAVPSAVTDPELITKDKQRIGLEVTADIFRPKDSETITSNYPLYRTIYTDDAALQQKVQSFTQQAMKVCVGERNFDNAVIGQNRDELRTCIDTELSKLVEPLGLGISNVAVPNVTISPEAQAALDAIVQSRLSTEKAKQDTEKATQEALANVAIEEGKIRVQQATYQETARQAVLLNELKQKQLMAELEVIKQEKTNAEAQLNLSLAQKKVAEEQAKIDLAKEIALAQLYTDNPQYVAWLVGVANANAIKASDKFFFAPNGQFPTFIMNPNGLPVSIPAPQ